ncbi:MAG: pilus assembly protein [Deltaproteobacteria bacterium]|nr:pilus assembly protein [Deltaproteobacteria bacterium]
MLLTKLRRENTASGQSGQGTIELILTMMAFFTIFFMFVQCALSFAVANYIQYATFMAARAFQAGYASLGDQKAAATSVLEATLNGNNGGGRFGSIAVGTGGGDGDVTGSSIGPSSRVHLAPSADARSTAWEQGVTYSFKVKLYLAPLIPGVNQGEDSKVTLESQSYLGREPTEKECEAVLLLRQNKSAQKHNFIYDNGC